MCVACSEFEGHLGTLVCRGQLAGLTSHLSAMKSEHVVYLFPKRRQVGSEPAMVAPTTRGQQVSSLRACQLRLDGRVDGAFAWVGY